MKEKTLAMLPWFPRDYISATRHMTLAERGAYTDLLFFEWDSGPLPNDPERLARLVGCSADDFHTIWPTVRTKFRVTADGLVNDRLERDRASAHERRRKASEKAERAAAARWQDAPSNAPSIKDAPSNASSTESPRRTMLGAMLEQCPPSPSPSPSPSLGEKRGNGGESPKPVLHGKTKAQNGNGRSQKENEALARRYLASVADTPPAKLATMYHLTEERALELVREIRS